MQQKKQKNKQTNTRTIQFGERYSSKQLAICDGFASGSVGDYSALSTWEWLSWSSTFCTRNMDPFSPMTNFSRLLCVSQLIILWLKKYLNTYLANQHPHPNIDWPSGPSHSFGSLLAIFQLVNIFILRKELNVIFKAASEHTELCPPLKRHQSGHWKKL